MERDQETQVEFLQVHHVRQECRGLSNFTGSDASNLRCFGTILSGVQERTIASQIQTIEKMKTCFKHKSSVEHCVDRLYPKAPLSIIFFFKHDTPKRLGKAFDCAQDQTNKEKAQKCFLKTDGMNQNTDCAKITSKKQSEKCFKALGTSILARMKFTQMESLGKLRIPDLSLMELENKKADEDNFEDDGINDEEHNEDVDDNGDDKEDDGEDVDDKGEAIEDDGTSDEEHTEDGEGDGNASFVNLEEENESKRCCRH